MSFKTTDSSSLQPHQPMPGELGYMYIDDCGHVKSCDGQLTSRRDAASIFYEMANQMSLMKLPVSPEKCSPDNSNAEETPDCIKVVYNDYYYVIAWDNKEILVRMLPCPKSEDQSDQ